MRRTRGFTLMEILIAMALTTIVTASVLAIVRTQLTAFEMQDQIVRAQQNTRAGMDFIETMVRRACGGINTGLVYVYTPNVKSTTGLPCLRVWDGAVPSATGFTSTKADYPDALEVVYASGAMTALTKHSNVTTTTPSVDVLDVCSFSAGDYVLLTDKNITNPPALFKVSAVTTCTTRPTAGTLSFGSVSPAPTTLPAMTDYVANTTPGTPVLKASTYSIFVANSTIITGTSAAYDNMLIVDSDGITSINHLAYSAGSSTTVQPAVENVIDFQVAVGNDLNANGNITDWKGATWGTLPLLDPATNPWNSATPTTMPQYRQVRLSVLMQTSNLYPGTPGTITAAEDRPQSTYPQFTAGNNSQRYRSLKMIVAPRAWNLSE